MKKRCLLLGGSGFIGKNLTEYLVEQGYDITVYDRNVTNYFSKEVLNQICYYERNFFDDDKIDEIIKNQDIIIHLISSINPESSMIYPENCYKFDIAKTVEVLELMRKYSVDKMIFISSGGTVYGDTNDFDIKENTNLLPKNHYAITKITIENILNMYNKVYGMKNIVLRLSNPYGPGQIPGKGVGAVTIFADKIVNKEKITIWGDGNIIRDYIYIDDVVKCITKFIELDDVDDYPIYNVGTGVGTSLNELIKKLENHLNNVARVEYKKGRNIDVYRNVLNIDKTMSAIGKDIINTSLDEGIKKYLKY